ncbi:hypothetical protein [Paenibacillus sp. QZ-Y1]|uniref:hypothetical protein n=1 Tax=Paenibacillus sp. QZ-Y1 TaxID=3414511 RepID=UPI003F797CFA
MGERERKVCRTCDNEHNKSEFYASYNKFDKDGKLSICKTCLKKSIDYNDVNTVKDVLLNINRPFILSIWDSAKEEADTKRSQDYFGYYIKSIGMKDFKDLSWLDSDSNESIRKNINARSVIERELLSNDPTQEEQERLDFLKTSESSKKDIIKLIGHDPFIYERTDDKPLLYNRLVDFLDEGTLEDGFKLPTVIEIVKGFNQLDKLNNAIASMNTDIDALVKHPGQIKSLVETKDKLYKSILALAKDNGISVNHNNNKSKGAGTLSAIIKDLQEKGFEEASINLFDIETSDGMKQVADISNKSIMDQLLFDENDYSEMIVEQRESLLRLQNENESLQEELRRFKNSLRSGELNV